jgi:hypothetical protein
MDLVDFLGPKPVIVDLRAEDRWAAATQPLVWSPGFSRWGVR